ncbi:hypothetical protein [Labilibacter marinus]|uniref:hypothetical protein n=1 Tax=Labilibacter marinus TaxID=1477105 RepID=UPI00094F72D8|nr:hypothetical protein [Labilibacter marinus]
MHFLTMRLFKIQTIALLVVSCTTLLLSSCRNVYKTTECVVVNQSDEDFTIYFSDRGQGDFIKSGAEKVVHTGEARDNNLSFPFDSDTVRVKLDDSKIVLFFAEKNLEEEDNIFDVYNWTYRNYTNEYTVATYTFTNRVLDKMEEKQ